MTINNNYNFGLLTDDGTTTNPTSLQDLKSFCVTYDPSAGEWQIASDLTDYEVLYFNKTQSVAHSTYGGLMVFNKKGKNFVIMCINQYQSLITSANFAYFTAPGTIPSMANLSATVPITYPELPTFINGFNGYNIPIGTLNVNVGEYTFYIMD